MVQILPPFTWSRSGSTSTNSEQKWHDVGVGTRRLAFVKGLRRELDRIERVEVGIGVVALFAGFADCMGEVVGIVEVADEEPFCTDPTNLAGAAAKQLIEPLGLGVSVDWRRRRSLSVSLSWCLLSVLRCRPNAEIS